jgi:hypothetical protein
MLPNLVPGLLTRLLRKAWLCYSPTRIEDTSMSTVEEIERAIERLPEAEWARLRDWFEERDAALFDAKIERDARAGKLDAMAQRALADHDAGRTRKL